MARPTDYRKEYAEQARKLCLLGYTDKEMAAFFGVTEQTINNWKKKHDGFFESIKKGKEFADFEVVESLFKRAKGYSYSEVKVKDDGGRQSKEVTKKEIPPDTTATIFWLKNRQPKKWRDKQEVEHAGKDGGAIQHDVHATMTHEEIAKLTPQELSRLAIDGKV